MNIAIEKWIQDVSPEDRVERVAAHTLQGRLRAVLHYLPLAAEKADEDSEDVHQLRVWTRRATAALRLYEPWLPRRRCAWMKKQLKRIRRAANEARDCDVLLDRLHQKQAGRAHNRWLETTREERAEAQKAIVAVHHRLTHEKRFERRIDKLIQRVRPREAEIAADFGTWARQRLGPLLESFFGAVPADPADQTGLHQFRIRGKELRYALELLAGAFPESLRTRLYPAVEEIQDRLGAINDLVTSRARLRHKVQAARDSGRKARGQASLVASWQGLLEAEQGLLDQACREFWEWCGPGRLRDLQNEFKALLLPAGVASEDPKPASLDAADPPPTIPANGKMSKTRMVGELGEKVLLLPALVNEALAANDRAKYWLTLLQQAREHADHPDQSVANLMQERLACGVGEADLDSVAAGSHKEAPDLYHIPGAGRIQGRLIEEVRRMLAPLHAQPAAAPDAGSPGVAAFDERLGKLLARAGAPAEDHLAGVAIDRLTSGCREAGDSLHLLVMDLHKELNRLQQQLATETIAGAFVYGLAAGDRPLVEAFMAGVNQTRDLKFSHPGLGTTATRGGERLVIQNDLGMTQAHVLVVHVEQSRVTLTYTDVHIERLIFFQGLFDRFGVRWEDTVSRRDPGEKTGLYHLCLGTYDAPDRQALLTYLTYLGSRLVFLIDWNRARKRLRKFAPRRVCLEVLRWAADHNYGHMGFLTLGGEQLIFDALQVLGKLPLPPGGQLSDFLGPERTAEFLKFTLQSATEGLRQGQSEFLIRDQISVELRHYIDTIHQRLLEVAAEHASLIVELALASRDGLLGTGQAPDLGLMERMVLRAGKWEHRADELVNRCRIARTRGDAPGPILDQLVAADDAADALEEAIFWISLLPSEESASSTVPLRDLAGLVLQGAQEYLKAVENARQLHRASPREQVEDFLEAVDRTMTLEHLTDAEHRRAQAQILSFAGNFKQWHLANGIADKLEETADALMRSVLILRDYILGEVLRH